MDEEKADQDEEKSLLAAQADGFRKNLEKGDCEHVAGAESEKGLQEPTGPLTTNHEVAADEICCGGDEAEGAGEADSKWQVVEHVELKLSPAQL